MHHLLSNYSDKSGADFKTLLDKIFDVMIDDVREELPSHFAKLPKLKNALFCDSIEVPNFKKSSRKLLLEISEFNWSDLNPDILGSLIQSVALPDNTSGLASHFTTSANTLKVLGPLFFDEFYETLDNNMNDLITLKELLLKVSNLAIFDPICGSGNFLIIAFKGLKKLEHELKKAIKKIDPASSCDDVSVSLDQFYGLEPNHFKTQIACIGLWAEYFQLNHSSNSNAEILLNSYNLVNIVCENPLRVSWTEFCKKDSGVYIVCNPTYKGSRKKKKTKKEDVSYVFKD